MKAQFTFSLRRIGVSLSFLIFLMVFSPLSNSAQITLGNGMVLPNIPSNPNAIDTLTIGLSESPPFVLIEDSTYSGINVWLWEKVAEEHGFVYRYETMPFGNILQGLENKELDLSINPMSITATRSEFTRFTLPYYSTNSAVAVLNTSFFNKTMDFLGTIFSFDFLKIIFFLFLTLLFFGFLMWFAERKHNLDQFEPGLKGIWSGVWWSAVTMTTVGYGDKAPLTLAGRIIALVWMFTAIVIISGFTGTVASSLTVQHLSWNVSKVDELKEHVVGTIGSSASAEYLQDHFFDDVKEFSSMDEALKALKKEEIDALVYDEAILRYRLSEPKYKHVKLLPFKFKQQFYSFGFAYSNNHDIEDKVSESVLRIIETKDWPELLKKYKVSQL